ncbi:hypothetical protein C4D60_Mb08t22260 [Musa balbisiana]|uniref:Protein kinase domain-containing protein n=1 Tax=Musa balbisiana TaxID=52838 RepID=A0A4S8K5L8_MUSBA|nr:hypothetical protein C4D60_Mb08t22260 [Musa balbisiana]
MVCFPCFGSPSQIKEKEVKKKIEGIDGADCKQEFSATTSSHHGSSDKSKLRTDSVSKKGASTPKEGNAGNIAAQTFTFRELATATKNFRQDCLLGEGGFGRVYKGRLETGQVVAVKQLDRNGLQGNREFLVEVLMLSLLHHPNLVNLIGYCADGDQRLLVYEFMPLGSLEDHLHDLELYVETARPLFKDRRKFPKMADPLLQGHYPTRGLYQALAVAAMCLQEQAATRPLIGDVVTAVSYLASQNYDPIAASTRSTRNGPSTPRSTSRIDNQHAVHSPHQNSPDFRLRDPIMGACEDAKIGIESSGGCSGHKWVLEELETRESQMDSPVQVGSVRDSPKDIGHNLDRERAVAEAKEWGESWRERQRKNTPGSFHSTT